jgi:hypothetical protein
VEAARAIEDLFPRLGTLAVPADGSEGGGDESVRALGFHLHRFQHMPSIPSSTGAGLIEQRFESILSQARFEGVKAIFARLAADRAALIAAILGTDTYEQLLGRLGHKLILIRQIHVQDCYNRVGREGGIKAVLPYHDIPTQSSFPTLVNFDTSVTTTPKAAAFFGALLGELKKELHAQSSTTH